VPTEYVAFDLETTGLDTARAEIIEAGAVRFTRDEVVGRFSTFVKPRQPIPAAIERLTGISDADLASAPAIQVVTYDIEQFLEGAILVGQNICGFDVPVLDAHGIRRPDALYDTQPLAEILLPAIGRYGLADLADHFGIDFPVRHRASADAEVTRLVFLRLLDRALGLPAGILSEIAQRLIPTSFPWRGFFRDAREIAPSVVSAGSSRIKRSDEGDSRPLRPRAGPQAVHVEEPLAVLALAARRPDVFPEFDERSEQVQMLEAVNEGMNRGLTMMVEAGTGTGKSLAYLIPAACEALANGTRVVVSTSTINLQEQLTRKDLPAVRELMGELAPETCQLKGRRNYLCVRRFDALQQTPALTDDEALLASKVLVWLSETETGDRGELRLSAGEESAWWRISADGAECTSENSPYVVDGSCFMLRARKRAEASHIVVVNHSLLLSDIAVGGHVIPLYQHLIVDEAHHLEDEATRQFGFTCSRRDLLSLLDRSENIAPTLQAAMSDSPVMLQLRQQVAGLAAAVREAARAARPVVTAFCDAAAGFLTQVVGAGDESRLHIRNSTRAQPDWSGVEVAWDNAHLALADLARAVERLAEELSAGEDVGMLNNDLVLADTTGCLEDAVNRPAGIATALEHDDPQRVVWMETDRSDGGIVISWVPLDVSDQLRGGLYADRRSVLLTGATLRSAGGFSYLQQRLGLEDCETLALGSPFDYRHQALVLVPRDLPDPNSGQYLEALSRTIVDLSRASRGRALFLFTSHSLLRAAHALAAGDLAKSGISALAQGVDGSPRQLVRALKSDPATVLFGTASFWEGVDIPGDNLALLGITRLPFAVPTDPIQAARASQYEDSFSEYSLPQAVIRFKQGFGRLIRTRTDKGVAVVLDQRVVTKQYGQAFLDALPGCPVRTVAAREMPDLVEGFLVRDPASTT
jgi:DNA polymerase-3 subunit epsilon/ATP-dependent DNA helicase DinG